MAPLPQWNVADNVTGYWGGSSTAITTKSKHQAAAAKFALWLNTDANAAEGLITKGLVYPASRTGQSAPSLARAPEVMAPGQFDFYARAKTISATGVGFTWGPNVNVAYSAYCDAFGKAVQNRTPFSAALDSIQSATVADLKDAGFGLDNG
jgi:multiple sugar transport system substrate-binding protein